MNMHSKVHIIFFLLNSGKNQSSTCYFLPASQKKMVFSLQTPGNDSASDVTGHLSCTANKTAFSTSEIGPHRMQPKSFKVLRKYR